MRKVYEKTEIFGTYDDTNHQSTDVYVDDEIVATYDPKVYPPFAYGGYVSVHFDDRLPKGEYKVIQYEDRDTHEWVVKVVGWVERDEDLDTFEQHDD